MFKKESTLGSTFHSLWVVIQRMTVRWEIWLKCKLAALILTHIQTNILQKGTPILPKVETKKCF